MIWLARLVQLPKPIGEAYKHSQRPPSQLQLQPRPNSHHNLVHAHFCLFVHLYHRYSYPPTQQQVMRCIDGPKLMLLC